MHPDVDPKLVQGWTSDLKNLGIPPGAVLLVRSDLRLIRPKGMRRGIKTDLAQTMLQALLTTVGPEGTVVMPAFTPSYVRGTTWLLGGKPTPFHAASPPATGALPSALLRHPSAVRTKHPTNSFVAVGPQATSIARFQTPHSHSFRPLEDIVNSPRGLQLLIGCVNTSPGFSTTHLAEHHLGLSLESPFSGRIRVDYVDDQGRTRTFKKADIPGCSTAFWRVYDPYRKAGILKEGLVGGAPSMLVNAAEAYEIDLALLARDRDFLICDNPKCPHCALRSSASAIRRLKFGAEVAKVGKSRLMRRGTV